MTTIKSSVPGHWADIHVNTGLAFAIFALDWPTESLCAGYRAWTSDEHGFCKPAPVRAAAKNGGEHV